MTTALKGQHTLTNLYSIRWRLLLTYAGIALLAAIALGGLLLFTLRSYYDQRERDYMTASADVVTRSAEQLLRDDVPDDVLQAATNIYAFIVLARVQVLDVDRQVIADSGAMAEGDIVSLEYLKPEPLGPTTTDAGLPPGAPPPATPDTGFETYLRIRREEITVPDISAGQLIWREYPMWSRRGALDRLLTGEASSESHTDVVVTVPLQDHRTHEVIGYLVLSEGPTFGTEIVRDVAEKTVVAGALAVLLAGVVGWFTSRRISHPVLALAETTARMAEGDLSVRANVDRRDEVGLLAHTFNTMAARVETTVVTLKRFVADAAHEINTPITALRTNLELAAASDQPDEFRADIAHAQTELTRLETLTHGLLTLARIEAHDDGAAHATIDLAALARQMHERYASRAEQAGITFRLDVPPGAVPIQVDEALVASVIENLLDNALKFTPEGGTVTLALRAEAHTARLEVTDTGIGIPPADVPKLFSRFYRASNASAYPGNGLGLVITRAIVEEHGGTISVDSAAGRTCFAVHLPRTSESTG